MTDLPACPEQIPETALDWHRAGRGAVLATVVETWGSAPRRAGSQMVIAGDGAFLGSVSGGCVEGAVVHAAAGALAGAAPRLLTFGVSDGDAFAAGLACGGTIRILLEPVTAQTESLLADLVAARAARRPVAQLVDAGRLNSRLVWPGEDAAIDERFRLDRSGITGDGDFVTLHNPPLRLIVIGAVHIARPLVTMARLCGYDPVLIDPRSAFATPVRFPGEVLHDLWPDEILPALAPDARTALVTLTHEARIDDAALRIALRLPVFYIGSLGSRRTHAARLERLQAEGFAEDELARIHAPVGLGIGAVTPAEIAVAILAQMTGVLRQGQVRDPSAQAEGPGGNRSPQ